MTTPALPSLQSGPSHAEGTELGPHNVRDFLAVETTQVGIGRPVSQTPSARVHTEWQFVKRQPSAHGDDNFANAHDWQHGITHCEIDNRQTHVIRCERRLSATLARFSVATGSSSSYRVTLSLMTDQAEDRLCVLTALLAGFPR